MAMPLESDTPVTAPEDGATESPYNDAELLEYHRKWRRESLENRWMWEQVWMRNIHYVNNRHWIKYERQNNEWRDVRLAKWVPKPVTNKIAEGLQALRAMFSSVNIGVNIRPGQNTVDAKNVAVASLADSAVPMLHEEHGMDSVLDEADFWFITTGNVFLHSFVEYDVKNGSASIPLEQCVGCQMDVSSADLASNPACPKCGGTAFAPSMGPDGAPKMKRVPMPKGVTEALSPFEIAFPLVYARFGDVPYVIRLRWRSKEYYEHNSVLAPQVKNVKWSKGPSDRSMQLFKSMPFHSELAMSPFLGPASGNTEELGAIEYEYWVRPCDEYPDGLIFRVLGENTNPVVIHLEEQEALPGPLPYKDAKGEPWFPFEHAAFESRGGRIFGTSPFDGIIAKQNLLNQLDSYMLMIIGRTANPLWLVPKGAEIEKFTGEPGLVVKWNPLTVGGAAKPERVDGIGPGTWMFQVRDMYLKDIEEGLATFDILKGAKPAGVESFSGLQLMVERGQSRFSSAFKARGNLYKSWARFALEIEREFGPEDRMRYVLSPAGTWAMQQFKKADLQSSFDVVVEDGSQTPKTTLGIRAAVAHLNSLGFINPQDPDQRYKIYELFGQVKLSPTLDIHMQAALRKQQEFEMWAMDPAAVQQSMQMALAEAQAYEQQISVAVNPNQALPPAPSPTKHTPLAWKKWYDPRIHKQEFIKWANSDNVRTLLQQNPSLEGLLEAHLAEIDMALAQQLVPAPAPTPGGAAQGAGQAMANANQEAGGSQNVPSVKGAAQEPA